MQKFPFNVSMYLDTPSGVESIHNQVEMARERLKLYKVFQHKDNLTLAELKSYLVESPLSHLLEVGNSPEILEARKIDYISHWLLRVAYSTNNSAFFIKSEVRWFKIRYNNMTDVAKGRFRYKHNFVLPCPSDEEKSKFHLTGLWYKIPWTSVTSLTKTRLYPLSAGFIFIPHHKLVYYLTETIQRDLVASQAHIKKVQLSCDDDQLKTVLSLLTLVEPYKYLVCDRLKLSTLDQKVKHFPLCMKFQHETLRKNHHLKHFSRVQYGLFLKGLGLSLDEALELWRDEFVKIMPKGRFWREYSYFFKHQYGTVGSKIFYESHCCEKILSESLSLGQINGCPYKHWDEDVLRKRLHEERVLSVEINHIVELKNQERYREACTRFFQCVHRCRMDGTIEHPNEFYEGSCKSGLVDIEDLFGSDSE